MSQPALAFAAPTPPTNSKMIPGKLSQSVAAMKAFGIMLTANAFLEARLTSSWLSVVGLRLEEKQEAYEASHRTGRRVMWP
jgi:hypothetical protein